MYGTIFSAHHCTSVTRVYELVRKKTTFILIVVLSVIKDKLSHHQDTNVHVNIVSSTIKRILQGYG